MPANDDGSYRPVHDRGIARSRTDAAAKIEFNLNRARRLLDEVSEPQRRGFLMPNDIAGLDATVQLVERVGDALLVRPGPDGSRPDVEVWNPETSRLVDDIETVAEALQDVVNRTGANAPTPLLDVQRALAEVFAGVQYLMLTYEQWWAKHAERGPDPGSPVMRDLRDLLRGFDVSLTLRRAEVAAGEARQSADVAKEASGAAKVASGTAAEVSLTEKFEALQVREETIGWWFRGAAIVLYVATILFAGMIAFGVLHSDGALSKGALQRLAPGVPTLLLAAFLGYQAKGHRQIASWASVVVAQLQTIRAYTAELDEKQAQQLRLEFGRRVFLESPDFEHMSTPGSDGSPDVVAIIREAAAIAERRPSAGA